MIDDEALADFAAMSVTIELGEPGDPPPDEGETDVILVWDVNWPAMAAFLALETQWRVVARGWSGVLDTLGLDYGAVDVVLRRAKAKNIVFEDLRAMERAALTAFDEIAATEDRG